MMDAQDGVPNWFTEIFPAGTRDGFYHKFDGHSVVYVARDLRRLVVSFDNLSDAGNPRYDREPWAAKFCRDNEWSHLGVFAPGPTWFRSADLIAFMERLRDDGFFAGFDEVTLCGASMGGYAALAFSDLAPGATVLAFSPQSTLNRDVVPWEHRFLKGQAQDWALPYADAADHVSKAAAIFVVYDPLDRGDKRHVARLKSDKIVHLKAIGLGHKSAMVMRRMERLKDVMGAAVGRTLTPAAFHVWAQDRKRLYIYRKTIENYLTAAGKEPTMLRFRAAFKRRLRAAAAATGGDSETGDAHWVAPLQPWPAEPGNIWMLEQTPHGMRYLSDRWGGRTLGYEERGGLTLAQTPPNVTGIVAFGDGVGHPRAGHMRHPWHVTDEHLHGRIPPTSAVSQADAMLAVCDVLSSVVAVSQDCAGITADEALPDAPAYQDLLARVEGARDAARAWDKSLFVDRLSLSLLGGAPQTPQAEARQHYGQVAAALRQDLARVTGQNSLPHVVVSQGAGTQSDGSSEVILAEGRLDVDFPNLGFVVATPKYPYPLQPEAPAAHTSQALSIIDALEVCAVAQVHRGQRWYCPLMHEAQVQDTQITARFFALSDLVLDAGETWFDLAGCTNDAMITSVCVAGKEVILTLDKTPEGAALELRYAWGRTTPGSAGQAANRGALRDSWKGDSAHVPGVTLRRYALSARVPVWRRG